MADAAVTVVGDRAAIDKLTLFERIQLDRLLTAAVNDVADFGRDAMRTLVAKRTGNLAAHITSKHATGSPGDRSASVEIDDGVGYWHFVDQGTGIFAHGTPIRPHTAKFLVWHEHGATIFAREVTGQRGQHFVEKAQLSTKVYAKLRWEELRARIHVEIEA